MACPASTATPSCRALRPAGSPRARLPVIVITARDTLAEPRAGPGPGRGRLPGQARFDLEELSARVRAALRRGAAQDTPELRHGAVALDPAAKRVTLDGAPVTLTAREFAVLHALMRRPAHIL